jgi:EF-P beta-lysylation protein EpmB
MSDIVTGRSNSVRAAAAAPSSDWQAALRHAVRDPGELCRLLRLPAEFQAGATAAARHFPLFAPRGYIARMTPGDPADPLLRQILPLAEETHQVAGFSNDPVGDARATRQPGLIHKYDGRVLMVTTGACAVHCRYCFRRHFPYSETPRAVAAWAPVVQRIASDRTVTEVILSGGDPLTLVDGVLAKLTQQLSHIGHLRRLRVHTRLPIMIPERVTDRLLKILSQTRLTTFVVVHANHAAELDASVGAALTRLVQAGIPVLNQSVLLRGVNDCVDALQQLSLRLIDLRIIPYYLHQLDRVQGAAHFEVPISRGRQLLGALQARLPGYAVPRYVRDLPGQPSKTILA